MSIDLKKKTQNSKKENYKMEVVLSREVFLQEKETEGEKGDN